MSRDLDLAAADLLDRAADYITEHGWTRHTFEQDGRVCAYGALLRVDEAFEAFMMGRAADLLAGHIRSTSEWTDLTITVWNDAQKSREPVIRTLREVAAEVRTRATDGAA